MARRLRCSDAGYVYHLLNWAVGRATVFDKPADYAAFEKVLRQAWERFGTRLFAFLSKKATISSRCAAKSSAIRSRPNCRGAPFGDQLWHQQTAAAFGLESALRGLGRPKITKGDYGQ
jgi:hypothetical protein